MPHSSASSGVRLCFFGGSFDPPHLGHLAVARAARDALRLDRVLFAPVGAQPLKPRGSTAPFADRLAMTRIAIAGEPAFEVSLADAPTSDLQPNYTVATLSALRAALPVGGSLFCLMGADSFASLRRWRGAPEIPFIAALVIASRPGEQLGDLAGFLPRGLTLQSEPSTEANAAGINLVRYRLRNPAGNSAPFYFLPGLHVEISASDIRSHLQSDAPVPAATRSLVPSAVAAYIRTHGLYQ